MANKPVTANIKQMFNYEIYEKSECSDLLREAGCGSGIIGQFPMHEIGEGYSSGIGVYRSPGRTTFTPREVRIAHIVMSEVHWLHKAGFTADEEAAAITPDLTNRQRQVMAHLLDGWGRKQIAHQIGISPNTVAVYIRDIYRHYNVGSHAELLRRFMAGDGNDKA
jgi:DNA-binding CsgD family transcriptional regulator